MIERFALHRACDAAPARWPLRGGSCACRLVRGGRLLSLLTVMALCTLLCACKVTVYDGLPEEEANNMLSTLLKHGISAQKTSAGKKGYAISAEESQIVQTLQILRDNNLPREKYQSLGSVFAGQGMIASATEEQARMAFALSQELANTFSRIDGVLNARVHVVLTTVDQATDTRTPPSASVFLRHTPESPVVNMVAKVREITANAVPGLGFDNVAVMLVPMRESVGVPMQAEASVLGISLSSGGPSVVLLGVLLFLLVWCAVVIYAGVHIWKNRRDKLQLP